MALAGHMASCGVGPSLRIVLLLPQRATAYRHHVGDKHSSMSRAPVLPEVVESGASPKPDVCCRAVSAETAEAEVAGSSDADIVRAVLFDMDGVLCNSEEISRNVGAQVMKELFGLDVQPDEFIPFVGMGEAFFLGGVAKKYGVNYNVEDLKAAFFNLYLAQAGDPSLNIAYTGARDLVRACRQAGLKTALASSADRIKADANLLAAKFDPASDFDAIVTADAFEKLKPSPDIFLAAAGFLGMPPRNCVVIEDAPAGVQAARAAGMRVIGVTTTLSEEGMREEGPDLVKPDISRIGVSDILSLKYPAESNGTNGGGGDQTSVPASPAEATSINVSL